MEYNTSRDHLIIPEYGRNVQRMVQHCLSIENREQRNKVAQSIIDVIGNLNPQIRDVPDFKHKLWDHMFIMSDFKLDVDSPYPIPTPTTFESKPDKVQYPGKNDKLRHYGHIVRKMIDYAVQLEDGPLKEGLIVSIANQMKKSYLMWNKDTVDDDVIFAELRILSKGMLNVSGIELSSNYQFRNAPQNTHPLQRNRNNKNRNKNNRKKFKKP
jgi:hypothetical protein